VWIRLSYKALYRKWRPQNFDEIVGQEHITKTLKNAFLNDKIAHAYLLCGPRGTGKTSTAKIIAKTVNCENRENGENCNACSSCTLINSGNSMDVIEIDGASNRGIDEIRDLREKAGLVPSEGKFKVYIIDEVHMLTGEAFNALLKTLEEPPEHLIFILATTEPHKIPATVLSRCQRFDFKRLSNEKMVERMQEICDAQNIEYEKYALFTIARFAEGGMRDALSILDQCISYSSTTLKNEDVQEIIGIVDYRFLEEFVSAIGERDLSGLMVKISDLVLSGKDVALYCTQLLDYLRNLLIVKVSDSAELLQVPQGEVEALFKQAGKMTQKQITVIMDNLTRAEKEMKWSSNSRILLELAVVKAVTDEESTIQHLVERVNRLENLMKNKSVTSQEEIPDVEEKENINEAEDSAQNDNATGTKLNLENVKSRWQDFLGAVKKNKITTYAFLVEAEPIGLEDGVLTVVFAEGYAFHKDKLQQKENLDTIKATFMEVYAEQVEFNIKLRNENENDENLTYEVDSQNNNKEDNRIVEEAVKLFGGNIVEIID
jgi:DNA polymerase-3 subunit gamma/tau